MPPGRLACSARLQARQMSPLNGSFTAYLGSAWFSGASRSRWRQIVRFWARPLSFPPVAQGSFQAAQGRVDEAVALGVGAVCVHPTQADVVEDSEVAPQGEVVAPSPTAARPPSPPPPPSRPPPRARSSPARASPTSSPPSRPSSPPCAVWTRTSTPRTPPPPASSRTSSASSSSRPGSSPPRSASPSAEPEARADALTPSRGAHLFEGWAPRSRLWTWLPALGCRIRRGGPRFHARQSPSAPSRQPSAASTRLWRWSSGQPACTQRRQASSRKPR